MSLERYFSIHNVSTTRAAPFDCIMLTWVTVATPLNSSIMGSLVSDIVRTRWSGPHFAGKAAVGFKR